MLIAEEFRSKYLAQALALAIQQELPRPLQLMEVCGSHTMSIARFGLKTLLPPGLKLISGPGCPVCVTAQAQIDKFIALGRKSDLVLTSFGDMLRVPGTESSLEEERARGADVRIVYSPQDALHIARQKPDKRVVFFGVGFETTTPAIALAVKEAHASQIANFFVLSEHKLIPPALRVLLDDPDVSIDGFICPGHVSVIIGSNAYQETAKRVPCVVAGFEPVDILQAILALVKQAKMGESKVEVQYRRVVTADGNKLAQQCVYEIFEVCDAEWRGLGILPGSGLRFRPEYAAHDAGALLDDIDPPTLVDTICECASVLKGKIQPQDCPAFSVACTPDSPIGPCMVSTEGACAAAYRYGGTEL
ncbi:MAG: hydrogenase formation protein HypD [Armatimonadota bacterium]